MASESTCEVTTTNVIAFEHESPAALRPSACMLHQSWVQVTDNLLNSNQGMFGQILTMPSFIERVRLSDPTTCLG